MRALALSIALLSVPSLASAQHASPASARLEEIRELVLTARFGDAVAAARRLLDSNGLSARERNGALEVLATAQIAMRADDDAQQTLSLLYARDPGHHLADPDASPPVIGAFARARERHPETLPVHLDHDPPRLTRREPPEIRVRVREGRDAVAEVRLIYRTGSEGTASVVMTPRDDGSYSARIPVVGDASQPTDVAYHVVALAPSLAHLAQRGSPAEPLQIRIPPDSEVGSSGQGEHPPAFQNTGDSAPIEDPDEGGGGVVTEWWFWTIIVGVVAIGVITGVAVGTSQSPTEGTLGTARLMQLEW